jgi:hypothetical protein
MGSSSLNQKINLKFVQEIKRFLKVSLWSHKRDQIMHIGTNVGKEIKKLIKEIAHPDQNKLLKRPGGGSQKIQIHYR